ncbi:MAG TPA: NAD-dependent epimerase/dehydratase family protein [Candidatus Udaeobacter sp.]|jgi:nucleoside-diphosphate-sugar epimerase
MPRILIAGCGYVGEATADLFHSVGWDVEAWVHSKQSAARLSIKRYSIRVIDVSQRADVAARAGVFDAIIHCVSSGGGDVDAYREIYLNGARHLLETYPKAKILFTSSTSVYAQRDGSTVTEQSETKPLRETSRTLLRVEKLILEKSGIIARLAGIYGPLRSALLSKFLNGTATIDPNNDRFVNQVHRDDIASALFLLLNREAQTSAQIYNLVDDQPLLQSDCYRWLAQRLNRPLPPTRKAEQPRKRGDSNKRVSNAKLHQLGWTPAYPTFGEAMQRSVLPTFAEAISTASH